MYISGSQAVGESCATAIPSVQWLECDHLLNNTQSVEPVSHAYLAISLSTPHNQPFWGC
jgi:hypothetical protein